MIEQTTFTLRPKERGFHLVTDEMPAHAKSSLVRASISIPITNGRLNMGIWQAIYLCEFRNRGGGRNIVATINR